MLRRLLVISVMLLSSDAAVYCTEEFRQRALLEDAVASR